MIRVHATSRGVNILVPPPAVTGPEDEAVEHQVGGTGGLVQIHVTAHAMVSGEMEYN